MMNKWTISATLAIFSISLVACGTATTQNASKGGAEVANAVSTAQRRTNVAPQQMHVENKVAQKLVQSGLVRQASVIIVGRTAYVGVQLKDRQSTDITESTKAKLTSYVKKADHNLQTVYVSASPDVLKHFQQFGRDIGNGRPVSGLWENFRSVVTRVWPTAR